MVGKDAELEGQVLLQTVILPCPNITSLITWLLVIHWPFPESTQHLKTSKCKQSNSVGRQEEALHTKNKFTQGEKVVIKGMVATQARLSITKILVSLNDFHICTRY